MKLEQIHEPQYFQYLRKLEDSMKKMQVEIEATMTLWLTHAGYQSQKELAMWMATVE